MSRSAEQLAQRRHALLAESAQYRDDLAAQGRIFKQKLAMLDTDVSLLGRVRQQPWLMAGIVFGVMVLKPQRVLQKAQTAILMFNSVRGVLPILMPLLQNLWQRRKA